MRKKKTTKNTTLILGGCIFAAMLLFLLAGVIGTPYDPDAMNGSLKFAGPSLSHPFGCDHFGRDVFSRVLKGTGTTFFVAAATLVLGGGTGILIGAFTGYFGGWIDEFLMRMNDAIVSFPNILLALVLISIFGPGKYNVILALAIVFIPSFARMTRSEFLTQKEMDYVKSARLMGVSHLRIIFVHILPNAVPTLLSTAAIGFNNAVLAEAGMSFLGIGVQPPDASLGRMLSEAQAYLMTAPWCAIFPGLAVILLALGVSLLGDGIQQKGGV
ncbi:MAG: ABC transporter permease [Lachnospiraceae bacterium]|nr:ABC transporter permease [Lachnospiraceae bacterium]